MKKLTLAARILLGLMFFVFGISGFFTPPPPMSGDIATYFAGIMASKYFFPLLKGTEVICGAFLLSGFFVPLALIVLAPIVLNIFMVHVFLAPEGLPIALVIGALEVYLSFFAKPYKNVVLKIFVKKA